MDIGDGESAVALLEENSIIEPVIQPIDGYSSVVSIVGMSGTEVRVGEKALLDRKVVHLRSRFKSRYLTSADAERDIERFAYGLKRQLETEQPGFFGRDTYVTVGCPAGWKTADRERYAEVMRKAGFDQVHIVSESRAAFFYARYAHELNISPEMLSQTTLIIDIGSSTTDFAYINKGKEAEIRTGGEVALGGGVMDEVLLNACVDASPNAAAIRATLKESESWRVDCELHARRLKEKYYSLSAQEREEGECSEALLLTYDEPVILDLVMNREMARRLTEKGCPQLDGRSFREVFCTGLRVVRESIGEPELLFLTGGVSRMAEIADWCRELFPKTVIYTDAEPEFSVARGLAWCGRIDDDLKRFRAEVDALIDSSIVEGIITKRLNGLYRSVLDRLLDPLMEQAVKPVLLRWKDGDIRRLSDMESVLQERIKVFLYSESAKELLIEPITSWLLGVSEELEQHTSRICRDYHVPERSLGISSGLSASDFHILEKIDARNVLAGDSLTWTAVFVDSVISIIVAMLCGGSGIVLISAGPVGMFIGFLLSFLVLLASHAMGKKAIDDKLMAMDLPLGIRRLVLSGSRIRIEGPRLGLLDTVGDMFSNKDAAAKKEEGTKTHLLPRIRLSDGSGISQRRMQEIRSRIKTSCETMLSGDNTELAALNERMSKDISVQIERRLKELAEQVEIPL